jgi:amino acid permease
MASGEKMNSSKEHDGADMGPTLEAALSVDQGDHVPSIGETHRGLKSRHIQLIALGNLVLALIIPKLDHSPTC